MILGKPMEPSHRSAAPEAAYSVLPFFDASSALLCIAGFDGYFRRVNPAVSKLLGYSEAELLAKPIRTFVHPDDLERTASHRDALLKGKPLVDFENRYLTKSGQTVWLSWSSIPVSNSELVYAIARNVTATKNSDQDRNRLLAQLTSTNERLKCANYATAHDIRSPLGCLLAALSLIDHSTITDVETLEILEVVQKSASSLNTMLDRYLEDIHEQEIAAIPCEPLPLHAVFQAVIEPIKFLINDSRTRIHLNFEAFDTIDFNRRFLESIFLNLVTNSIKYAHPDRDPVISITSRMNRGLKGNIKELVFADNGIGFDAEHNQDNIFKLNQKFHDHKDSKGVGLYLVRHHLQSLGADISVSSQVNKGTTFTLRFAP